MTSELSGEQSSNDDELQYFQDSLGSIFDDVVVSHGEPGGELVYDSVHGQLSLRLTTTSSWEELLKFSHFIWEAELNMAKRIEQHLIDVKNSRLLVLGAGAGLCGILAMLNGAREVVLSDYPAESMISNLTRNVDSLIPGVTRQQVSIVGHVWGENTRPLTDAGSTGRFDIILIADCLWMPEQHEALCKSLAECLAKSKSARIYCVAGFHSGRRKMSAFFPQAERMGLIPDKEIFEVDRKGSIRKWSASRPEEDSVERKRWLVVADLGWRFT